MNTEVLKRRSRKEERTGFQEYAGYMPECDLHTDFVMVYGIDPTLPERISQWRKRGYEVHLMTGISWGNYRDYLNGEYDGRDHWDEAQTRRNGSRFLHEGGIPYMVPTISYADYLIERIKVAIDAGVEAIHLEEPEFWVVTGYSDAFKREWELFYREKWIPPHESYDAQYRASKLKAYLYTRCLDRLCSSLKEYAKVNYGRNLRFYVPTHSLINYTQWNIVSPESRLLTVPSIDGYIAQIWTGTARTCNVYEGVRKERTFETAFLEYGIMQELVRGTDRHMWFLHDPIEDNYDRTWGDFRYNYLKTLVASLMHPAVSDYEVAPWPKRIFTDPYPRDDGDGKSLIPPEYATTVLTMMNTLADMKQEEVCWEGNNPTIGILIADSGMFQRNRPENTKDGDRVLNEDKTTSEWSPFYGLALPILKHGMPVRPLQLDNIRLYPGYLDDYKVIILSYEFIKPEYPDIDNAIGQWVRDGGVLIYVGDDSDPFHKVREWWNQGKRKYTAPSRHLFESMGLGMSPANGIHHVGNGIFAYLPVNPEECANKKACADMLRCIVKDAMEAKKEAALSWKPGNSFVLRRGPYVIAAVLDESVSDEALWLSGRFIKLFDTGLPFSREAVITPGNEALLFDLDRIPAAEPLCLIAAASRIDEFIEGENGFCFTARGPKGVDAAARFFCARRVGGVSAKVDGQDSAISFEWDEESSTVLMKYPNCPEGIGITVSYG